MDKKAKERKEYQKALVNLQKSLEIFDDSIRIMEGAVEGQDLTVAQMNEISNIILKNAKLCKKVAEDAKENKRKQWSLNQGFY